MVFELLHLALWMGAPSLNDMKDIKSIDTQLAEFRTALEANAAIYGVSLTSDSLAGLLKYYQLLEVWNARLHLVAPSSPGQFATRHVLESLLLLEHLPPGAAVADIGSGGGLPIIPCLIVRPDLRAVMVEASPKKAVFLNEALREVLPGTATAPPRASVLAERFENIAAPPVDFITCRALERFEEMVTELLAWAPEKCTLLLFGGEGLQKRLEAAGVSFDAHLIPNSQRRYLIIVKRANSNG